MCCSRKKLINFIVAALLLLCGSNAYAQDTQQAQQAQPQILQPTQVHPASKMSERYEVDAKRMGVSTNSEDALPRSREFIRIDSTYYVGWLYEGAYKYYHAADFLGYKNAVTPLETALRQIERDYRKQLGTRTAELMTYYPAYKFQIDYTMIAMYLMHCYSNMEEPDKVYTLLRRVLKWNFQREYFMDAYNFLGWTVHRNRFYTHDKYKFLKNSIDENEQLANRYLDSQMRKINRDMVLNAHIFQPGYEKGDKLSVYHYKCILYSYSFNIDSAMHYFNLMRNTPVFPHNNFATFRAICGDFREAEKEYKQASAQESGDKRLQEWAYYTSILDIYKGQPKSGIELSKDMILANGSTPGFGWYNIGLARCMYYDGQIREAERYINKAAEFKEVHIGTTLGQSIYDFSVQLDKLMNLEARWQRQEFENKNWWYNPVVLSNMSKLLGQKYMQQFLIINQFAQNPERDRVIYKLFSTESTVSWDEIWYLIKDFSTQFFLDRFKKEAATDNRKYIRKYFQLFIAKLQMKQGNYTEARKTLDEILQNPDIDRQYEKLFIARVYEAEAECARERKDKTAYNSWMYRLCLEYPQLVPNSGLEPNMQLQVSGDVDNKVVSRLKACSINWVTNSAIPSLSAYMIFKGQGEKRRIEYYVLDKEGNYVVPRQTCLYSTRRSEDAGVDMAYRLFNIGGKIAGNEADKEQ